MELSETTYKELAACVDPLASQAGTAEVEQDGVTIYVNYTFIAGDYSLTIHKVEAYDSVDNIVVVNFDPRLMQQHISVRAHVKHYRELRNRIIKTLHQYERT